jgi:tetratricopeptide (TPR) repeat protein
MPGRRKLAAFCIGVILLAPAFGAGFAALIRVPIPVEDEAGKAYELGMRLLGEKRYQEALEQFELLERDSPRLPQGYTGEGITLALMGKPEESIEALKKALDIDSSFWVARRELGIVYWQANRKDLAAKELGEIAKQFPNDPAVSLLLGQYEFERSNYAQASAYFGKARVQVAADARLSLMAAEAQLKSGMKAPARAALEALAASPGFSPQQRFHLAWLLGEADDYVSSIHVLQSLPDDYADQFGRSYAIALAYYEDGQYANCIKTLSDLKSRKILRPELFSLLGAAEENSHHTLEAYNAFREGIYAFPTDDQNYLDIAALSAEHLNYELAAQIVTSGIGLMPSDYKLYLARGVIHSLARQLESAHADYEKALALAPNRGEVYVALGIGHEDENKYDEAAATFRLGTLQQPKDALLYYFLADSLFRKGISVDTPAYQETLSAVESSLALDAEFAYAYLQRARLELMSHQTNKAIKDLEHGHSLAPDSREISYQLAVAYRTVDRKAEAEKLFNLVTEATEKDTAEFRTGQLRDVIVTLSNLPHKNQ